MIAESQLDTIAHQAADWSVRHAPPHVRRDDLIQEARIAIWEASTRFDGDKGATLKTWVTLRAFGACRNFIASSSRNQACTDITDPEKIAWRPSPETDFDLEDAIRRLPRESRTVITLIYFTGFTCDEAARVLRISATLVKRRRDAALVRLRSIMGAAD